MWPTVGTEEELSGLPRSVICLHTLKMAWESLFTMLDLILTSTSMSSSEGGEKVPKAEERNCPAWPGSAGLMSLGLCQHSFAYQLNLVKNIIIMLMALNESLKLLINKT